MNKTKEILECIANILGTQSDALLLEKVAGGSINEAYSIVAVGKKYFCKINNATAFPGMMKAEKNGLLIIEKQKVIRVPEVLAVEEVAGLQFILMEHIEPGKRTNAFWEKFGEQLAALHYINSKEFGFIEYNYMGSLTQDNTQHKDWPSFFIERRIKPQINLAVDKKMLSTKQANAFEKLFEQLPFTFPIEEASLLHGDLWSGNFLCNENGNPVLIDPAVYYGSRHMDLAMTTLFGGFDKIFYDSYHFHFPLPHNYKTIWKICNLYPLLIHLNLFGKSYLGEVLDVLNSINKSY